MSYSAINSFDLGELDAGTDVEVVLVTPAIVRLVPDGEGAIHLSENDRHETPASLQAIRHLAVPRSGRWRLLVEHSDSRKKGGCAIRLIKNVHQLVNADETNAAC